MVVAVASACALCCVLKFAVFVRSRVCVCLHVTVPASHSDAWRLAARTQQRLIRCCVSVKENVRVAVVGHDPDALERVSTLGCRVYPLMQSDQTTVTVPVGMAALASNGVVWQWPLFCG